MDIRHLSLDVWQTLIRGNEYFRQERAKIAIACFELENISIVEVTSAFSVIDSKCNQMAELIGCAPSPRQMICLAISDLKPLKQVSEEALLQFEVQMQDAFFAHSPLIIDVNLNHLLSRVKKKGISIALLCNTGFVSGLMLRQFWEKIELDQFFDFQCYSDEAGICKPNLLYYDMAHKAASNLWSAKDHKLLPQEVLHIGDNQITDIEGAINYGWKASLVLPEPGSLSSILNQIGQE